MVSHYMCTPFRGDAHTFCFSFYDHWSSILISLDLAWTSLPEPPVAALGRSNCQDRERGFQLHFAGANEDRLKEAKHSETYELVRTCVRVAAATVTLRGN